MTTLPKKLLGFGAFIRGGRVIRIMKHADADDLVLLAKEDMVLQGMIERLKKLEDGMGWKCGPK